MDDQRKPALGSIRSDALRALLDLRDEFPLFRRLLDDIIQIVMVLDASAIQGELRWRLRRRTKPAARTGLHEAVVRVQKMENGRCRVAIRIISDAQQKIPVAD